MFSASIRCPPRPVGRPCHTGDRSSSHADSCQPSPTPHTSTCHNRVYKNLWDTSIVPCLNCGFYLLKELVPPLKLLVPLLKLLVPFLKCCWPFLHCWCTSKLRSPGDEPFLTIYGNFLSDSQAAMSVFMNDIKVGDTFSIREKAELLARFSTTDSNNFTWA